MPTFHADEVTETPTPTVPTPQNPAPQASSSPVSPSANTGDWWAANAPPAQAKPRLDKDAKKPAEKKPAQSALSRIIESSEKPLVDFTKLGTPSRPTHSLTGRETPKSPDKVQQVVGGAVKGVESTASGFTSPQNLALLAATFGTGAIPVVGKLVSLGFSADMLKSAAEKLPKLKDQVQKGDIEGAAQTLTEAGITASMGVGGLTHAFKGETTKARLDKDVTAGTPKGRTKQPPLAVTDSALHQLLKVQAPGPKRQALIAEATKRGIPVPELPTRGQEVNEALGETARVDAQFDEAEKRLAAKQQSRNPPKARKTAKPPFIPETGVPEGVARVQDARERIIGKPKEQWSNADILTADKLIAEGYTGATGSAEPSERAQSEKTAVPPVKTPEEIDAERLKIIGKPKFQWKVSDIEAADQLRAEGQIGDTRPGPKEYKVPPAVPVIPKEGPLLENIGEGAVATPVAKSQPPAEKSPAIEEEPATEAASEPVNEHERPAEGSRAWEHGDPVPPENTPVRMKTSDISADPQRFQYKSDAIGKGGTTDEFRGVKKWDESSAGVLQVWRDPADGKVYVANGHHRLEMANRLDVPEVSVKFIDASDAVSARIRGALTNIRDGKGTSIDAAKVFRDGGITPEEMEREGISTDGKVSKEGIALSGLSDRAFQKVVDGSLLPAHGAVIGEKLRGQTATQDSMIDWLKKQRVRYNANEIGDIAEQWKRFEENGPAAVAEDKAQGSMFDEDVAQKNYFGEKAQIQEEIRQKMKGDKKLFGLLGKQTSADKLEGVGKNVIDVEGNQGVASKAAQILEVYQKLVNKAGGMENIITDAARKVAEGMSVTDATTDAYPRISAEIERILNPSARANNAPEVAKESSGARGTGSGVQSEEK